MDFNNFITNFDFTSNLWQIICPICFMIGDIISGFIQAVINKNVETQKMREGIYRKFLLIMLIFLSYIIQFTFGINFISKGVSIYIIFMEILSILENLKKAGVNLEKLGEILKIEKREEK